MSNLKYLGLDQALQTTGWAIYENAQPVHFGHFTISPSKPIEQRLGQIWTELNELYTVHEFNYVFLEDIQRQQNVETYKKLAYVQATVMLWCFFKEIKYSVLGPSHWRSIIKEKFKVSFGKTRTEQKIAAQNFIKEHYNIEASEDECDALCLTLAGIQEIKKKTSAF